MSCWKDMIYLLLLRINEVRQGLTLIEMMSWLPLLVVQV